MAHPMHGKSASVDTKPMELVRQESGVTPVADKNRAVRILAKSIFRELTSQGYDEKQIVNLATELISEVTTSMGAKTSVSPE